jgi:hypothetical protein
MTETVDADKILFIPEDENAGQYMRDNLDTVFEALVEGVSRRLLDGRESVQLVAWGDKSYGVSRRLFKPMLRAAVDHFASSNVERYEDAHRASKLLERVV